MPKFGVLIASALVGLIVQAGGAVASPPDSDNPVVEWNRTLLAIVRTPGAQPATVHPTRSMAIMHAAIHDAVNSIERRYEPYAISLTRTSAAASQEAAAAAAAHEVLTTLYPNWRSDLDVRLEQSLAQISDDGKSAGIAVGRAVASALLALRANDGSNATPVPFVFRDVPGEYQSTPPNFPQQPAFTHWPNVAPFALPRASRFRPGPPPVLASPTYRDELNEVESIGAATGGTASAEQVTIGRFWNGPIQNYWNEIAQTVTLANDLTTAQSARLFALLNLVAADSAIAFYEAKYTYRFWRPVTAIRAAGNDGNPGTAPDPQWLPRAGNSPADPSFPGAHAVVSGASATVLKSFFRRDQMQFDMTSETLPGITRSFRRFSDAAEEATLSRIYAGVHFRSDEIAGHAMGRQLAEFILRDLSKSEKGYHDVQRR